MPCDQAWVNQIRAIVPSRRLLAFESRLDTLVQVVDTFQIHLGSLKLELLNA